MPRRLLTILSALSLLLFLLVAMLCLRSHYTEDTFTFTDAHGRFHRLSFCAGAVYYAWESDPLPPSARASPAGGLHHYSGRSDPGPWIESYRLATDDWESFGFGGLHASYATDRTDVLAEGIEVRRVPFWPFFLITSLPPTLWTVRFSRRRLRRRSRRRLGLCPTCSYDLRASKDICPECGSPIPETANNN